jgi:MAF protein
MFNDKVYLASASPRRRELLAFLFNDINYLKSLVDEPFWKPSQSPEAYLDHCLECKWQGALMALSQRVQKGHSIVIVADTTVVLKKSLLEKPTSPQHAIEMLKELSGKTHRVVTGLKIGKVEGASEFLATKFSVTTEVTFHKLSSVEISDYVKTGHPMDKAGAYGFQDQALKFVKSLKGSYLNVVGFPVLELQKQLIALGVK